MNPSEPMPRWLSFLIGAAIFIALLAATTGVSMAVSFIGGLVWNYFHPDKPAISLWQALAFFEVGLFSGTGIYLWYGLRFIPQNEFLVIERFGRYVRTVNAGPRILCFPDIVDRVAPNGGKGDYKKHRIDLYADEPGNELDFKEGGSAAVKVQVWYRIYDPAKWVYAVKDSENRIEEISDGVLRSLTQKKTIEQASKNLSNLSRKVQDDPGVKSSLAEIGAVLESDGGVIITDIVLGQRIQELRNLELEGTKEASKWKQEGRGFYLAVKAIMDEATAAKNPITYEQAKDLYLTRTAQQAYERSGAKSTFVSPDIKGVGIMLGAPGSNPQP